MCGSRSTARISSTPRTLTLHRSEGAPFTQLEPASKVISLTGVLMIDRAPGLGLKLHAHLIQQLC